MHWILFLCTGNYYRSRFAEEYFNYQAINLGLKWRAFSKGLSENFPNENNVGPVSAHTLSELEKRNIMLDKPFRFPVKVDKRDFLSYHKIIAISKDEHKPMIEDRFASFIHLVEYFEVGDLPVDEPGTAMMKLTNYLDDLLRNLQVGDGSAFSISH